MDSPQEENKSPIANESVLIDISLCSSSYETLSKTDLVDAGDKPNNKKKRGCCYCCVILTVSTIVSFTGLFLCHIIKKM